MRELSIRARAIGESPNGGSGRSILSLERWVNGGTARVVTQDERAQPL